MTELYPFLESKKWYLLFKWILWSCDLLVKTTNNINSALISPEDFITTKALWLFEPPTFCLVSCECFHVFLDLFPTVLSWVDFFLSVTMSHSISKNLDSLQLYQPFLYPPVSGFSKCHWISPVNLLKRRGTCSLIVSLVELFSHCTSVSNQAESQGRWNNLENDQKTS